jgi:tetratricopeptide (TPR) repeat protein
MIRGWQKTRRVVLSTVVAAIFLDATPDRAAGDDSVTAECRQTPTPSCMIDAGVNTMRSAMIQPDAYARVLMGRMVSTLVHARIAMGDLKAAHTLAASLRDVKEPHVYKWALQAVAMAEARNGDLGEAVRLLDSVENDSRAQLLIAIADRQAIEGTKEEAKRTLASALDAMAAARSQETRVFIMVGAGDVLTHLGDERGAAAKLREARGIADKLPREVFRSVSLSLVASAYAKKGDFDTALLIVRSIPRNSFRSGGLVSVARAATKKNEAIDARALIEEALAVAREDTFPVSRVGSLGDVAALQSSLGDHPAADRTIDEALGVAEGTKDRLNRASAFHAVALSLTRSGNPKRGLEVAMTIDMAPERALAFFDMAVALAAPY